MAVTLTTVSEFGPQRRRQRRADAQRNVAAILDAAVVGQRLGFVGAVPGSADPGDPRHTTRTGLGAPRADYRSPVATHPPRAADRRVRSTAPGGVADGRDHRARARRGTGSGRRADDQATGR